MQEYSITVPNGMETTVLLSDEEAKRAGLLSDSGRKAKTADPASEAKGSAPANKSGSAENKSG